MFFSASILASCDSSLRQLGAILVSSLAAFSKSLRASAGLKTSTYARPRRYRALTLSERQTSVLFLVHREILRYMENYAFLCNNIMQATYKGVNITHTGNRLEYVKELSNLSKKNKSDNNSKLHL